MNLKQNARLYAGKRTYDLAQLRGDLYRAGIEAAPSCSDVLLANAISFRTSGAAALDFIQYQASYGGFKYQAMYVLTDGQNNFMLIYAPKIEQRSTYYVQVVNNPTAKWCDLALSTFMGIVMSYNLHLVPIA